MKKTTPQQIFNPFKDSLTNTPDTKVKSDTTELIEGSADNNYLKSKSEIEAEMRSVNIRKEQESVDMENKPGQNNLLSESVFLKTGIRPMNFHPLEEALAGEMEENY